MGPPHPLESAGKREDREVQGAPRRPVDRRGLPRKSLADGWAAHAQSKPVQDLSPTDTLGLMWTRDTRVLAALLAKNWNEMLEKGMQSTRNGKSVSKYP